MKKHITTSILSAAIICLTTAGTDKTATTSKPVDVNNFDQTVKPGDDFYQHVNGTWVKNNPVPAAETRWGSFSVVDERTREQLKSLLDDLAKMPDAPSGTAEQKLKDFYRAAMDTVAIEKAGITPLQAELKKIDRIQTKEEIAELTGYFYSMGIRPFFSMYVGQDDKDATKMCVNLNQGGLGLPDKDYYLKEEAESAKMKAQYMEHINNMFRLCGMADDKAGPAGQRIVMFETILAKGSKSRTELRDPEANYNKMGLDEFMGQSSGFGWEIFLKNFSQAQHIEYIVVGQPKFFSNMSEIVANTSLEDLKLYMKWNLINSRADALNNALVKADFDFYEGVLRGAKEMKPRWKRVLDNMNGSMGELLGQLYVKKYFSKEAKARVNDMVANLITAYRERIESRTWMAPETKKAALAKLDKIVPKLAYPDKWRDFTALSISPQNTYYDNLSSIARFGLNYNFNKLGKPIDKTEWGMSPQTVNAYYNPGFNEIVFPAAIMQPPFFYPDGDDAVNYGAMGAVIGHEITHGFDDQGQQYDAEGNLKNWWTEEDKKRFRNQADKLVKQFSNYIAIDSLTVNGDLTQGENIADLGGLTIAFAALEKTLAGKRPVLIDGFTPQQRFFISFAQVWRNNIRDAELKRRLRVDPHSPGRFRTLGPLSNMPEFYKAFSVVAGNKMYRNDTERVEIW